MTWDDEFTDKRGRKITFDVGEGVRAYYEGKGIGELTLIEEEYDETPPIILASVVTVDAAFRNAGIASEMVRLAFELYGPIVPPDRCETEPSKRNTITDEGMRLLVSGQRKGWIAQFLGKEEPDDFNE